MSISSVITGGFGTPGSASLVITDGYGTSATPPSPALDTVTPGKRKRDPWRDAPEIDWAQVAQRVEASLERDRAQRREANKRKLLLLMAA